MLRFGNLVGFFEGIMDDVNRKDEIIPSELVSIHGSLLLNKLAVPFFKLADILKQ